MACGKRSLVPGATLRVSWGCGSSSSANTEVWPSVRVILSMRGAPLFAWLMAGALTLLARTTCSTTGPGIAVSFGLVGGRTCSRKKKAMSVSQTVKLSQSQAEPNGTNSSPPHHMQASRETRSSRGSVALAALSCLGRGQSPVCFFHSARVNPV